MGRSALLLGLLLAPAFAQLRPRRVGGAVGVSPSGEQEPVATGDGGADLDALQGMMEGLGGMQDNPMLKGMMEGLGNMQDNPMLKGLMDSPELAQLMSDPEALLNSMKDNPMLKGLMQDNPEMAKMMSDPEAMQEKLRDVTKLMASEEGQGMAKKMMEEMQSVLTDPEKLMQGLEQLSSNPELAGMANMVPGLREVMDDPVAMREQVQKTAEMFQKLQDPEAMQEALASMGGAEGMKESMEKAVEMLAGIMPNGEGGAGVFDEDLGSEDSAATLKDRVNKLAASLMNKQAGSMAAELDDEF